MKLGTFYPTGNFDGEDPQRFFSNQISLRFSWHYTHVEPYGRGTGGTIVGPIVAGNVMSDVEKMVEEMAVSLVDYDDRFDEGEWSGLWNR